MVCRPMPCHVLGPRQESVEASGAFSVLQPGSSVATALSEGESRRKHIVMLEVLGQNVRCRTGLAGSRGLSSEGWFRFGGRVHGGVGIVTFGWNSRLAGGSTFHARDGMQWRTVKLPLRTVRPFVFESVSLASAPGMIGDDPDAVTAWLEARVLAAATRAVRGAGPSAPPLPLVRLRVDYSGFSTINTQRFGHRFLGKVANPTDLILWQKSSARRGAAPRGHDAADGAPSLRDLPRAEALDEARIEDLVAQHLVQDLQILPELELAEALHDFVEKDNRAALAEAVGRVLLETQDSALQLRAAPSGAGRGGEGTDLAPRAHGGSGGYGAGTGLNGAAGAAVKSSPSRKAGDGPAGSELDVDSAIAAATRRRRAGAAGVSGAQPWRGGWGCHGGGWGGFATTSRAAIPTQNHVRCARALAPFAGLTG